MIDIKLNFAKFYFNILSRLETELSNSNNHDIILSEPPTKVNWPNRGLVDYDNEFLKIYEEKCFEYYKNGKWTPKRVALAYIDLIPACEMKFEINVCYINSALWLLKEVAYREEISTE
jgi:hypothetical protein